MAGAQCSATVFFDISTVVDDDSETFPETVEDCTLLGLDDDETIPANIHQHKEEELRKRQKLVGGFEDAQLPHLACSSHLSFHSMPDDAMGQSGKRPADEGAPVDLHATLVAALTSFGAARAADLEPIRAHLADHDREIAAQKKTLTEQKTAISDLQKTLDALRAEVKSLSEKSGPTELPNMRGGGTGSAGSSVAPSNQSEEPWAPRSIHVRGFASYGCPSSNKLTKAQCRTIGQELLDIIPPEVRSELQLAAPYVLNHQLTLLVSEGNWDKCRRAKLTVEKAMAENDFKIRGRNLTVGAQTSPARRHLCANLFKATAALKKLQVRDEQLEICHRTLTLCTLPGYQLLGQTCKSTNTWTWSKELLPSLGLQATCFDDNIFGGSDDE